MKKTYRGSCHCGRITFEVDLDLSPTSATTTSKCNCTSCWKRRYWGVSVKPEEFRSTSGEDAMIIAERRDGSTGMGFCKHCGVNVYGRGEAAEWNDGAYVSLNIATLDDLDPQTLVEAPVIFVDGRANTWAPLAPADARHL